MSSLKVINGVSTYTIWAFWNVPLLVEALNNWTDVSTRDLSSAGQNAAKNLQQHKPKYIYRQKIMFRQVTKKEIIAVS